MMQMEKKRQKTVQQGGDALQLNNISDVMIDHCSFSWGDDGVVDLTVTDDAMIQQPEAVATIQWSVLSQPLKPHAKTMLLNGKFGGRYTIFRNWLGHGDFRNPAVNTVSSAPSIDDRGYYVEFVNNVVHGWGQIQIGTAESNAQSTKYVKCRLIKNCYVPTTFPNGIALFMKDITETDGPTYYVEVSGNSSKGGHSLLIQYSGENATQIEVAKTPLVGEVSESEIIEHPDNAIVEKGGGSSRPKRDPVDFLFLGDPVDRYEIIHEVSENEPTTPIYPSFNGDVITNSNVVDSDNDGIPDEMEGGDITKFHPWADNDGDGFTNLEEYLNGTDMFKGEDPLNTKFSWFSK